MLHIFVSNISFFVAWNDFCRNSPYTICSEGLEKKASTTYSILQSIWLVLCTVNSAHDVMNENVFHIAGFWGELLDSLSQRTTNSELWCHLHCYFWPEQAVEPNIELPGFEISWCLCDLTVIFIVKNKYVGYIPIDQADICIQHVI